MRELPPLPPDPAGTCEVDCGPDANGNRFVRYEDGYSADQMRSFARQAVAEAMERAAQICDEMVLYTGYDCAAAIRAAIKED